MGVIVALLSIVGFMVLWAFYTFPPDYANKKQVGVFNWCCVIVCGMVCGAYALNIEVLFATATLEKYKSFVMIGGALAIEIVFLGVMFLMRNFWVFRPKDPSKGYY